MTAQENILAQITRLLEEGAMPRSACSGSLLRTLRPLLHAAVVVEERSGGGRRLVVRDATALQEFSRRHFPVVAVSNALTSRIAGVARFRDSKALANDTPEIVSVRAWSPGALVKEGQPTEAVSATAQYGVFSFLLCEGKRYTLHGSCALVENPAVFTKFEGLQLPVGLVIYGQGRASKRLVEWLATMATPDFGLIHLPDYDPVGLVEFKRLQGHLGDRVHLHLPNDIDQRFARFSNRALLEKPNNRAVLANLRRTTLTEVRRVVALIDCHNAGLEQEALLL